MADEPENPTGDDEEEEEEEVVSEDNMSFEWEGGDIAIFRPSEFVKALGALAVRTKYKTGDLEILSADGKAWKKLGRHLKSVDDK